ncbi:VOC family protein [Pseudooctadecabacter sp.]|uniref:VOC family protein n=1 Tax=Pseudooctadecabacter sp. TaxID=1966338 RepID=UPI0035C7CDC2
MARLEHVNISVADGAGFAAMLQEVFGWHVRWEGPSTNWDRYSRHVGEAGSYVAIYETGAAVGSGGVFNHLGVVVDDLDAVLARVKAYGLTSHHHADYEPGRRFYFMSSEGVEIEIVQYD